MKYYEKKEKLMTKIPSKKGSSNDFQTPAFAIDPLLPYIKKEWMIWECACGKGNLIKAFISKGYKVFGTDIINGVDFVNSNNTLFLDNRNFDCIITNPPYSLKNEFLETAYEIGKPFAFLLPLTTLESKKRQSLFKKYGLEVILFNKRINFEIPSGKGKGSWFATAWFTHKLDIGKELTFSTIK